MITERDLQEAIAECQGKRDPGASDCIKLAAFYIIRDNMYPEKPVENNVGFSNAPPPEDYSDPRVHTQGASDFLRAIDGMRLSELLPVMDELMSVLATLHPRLYDSVLLRLD